MIKIEKKEVVKKRIQLLAGLLVVVTGCLVWNACKLKSMKDQYAWGGTLSAPREYPMKVLQGYIMSDEYSFGLNWSEVNEGWGNGSGTIHGSTKKELPDSLLLLWLSFAEEKFYRGEFELPREKILHYMREGFVEMEDGIPVKKTYETFVVGLAPEGRVAVWLTDASEVRQVEVARFQGREETELNPQFIPKDDQHIFKPDYIPFVMGNEKIMQPEVKERIATHGYPLPAVYDAYARRYLWELDLRLPPASKVTFTTMKICNGEREFTWEAIAGAPRKRGIPYLFRIHWENPEQVGFGSWLTFSKDSLYWKKFIKGGYEYLPLDFAESQIRHVFETKINPEVPAKLVLDIYASQNGVKIFLEQEGQVFPIQEFVSSTGKK